MCSDRGSAFWLQSALPAALDPAPIGHVCANIHLRTYKRTEPGPPNGMLNASTLAYKLLLNVDFRVISRPAAAIPEQAGVPKTPLAETSSDTHAVGHEAFGGMRELIISIVAQVFIIRFRLTNSNACVAKVPEPNHKVGLQAKESVATCSEPQQLHLCCVLSMRAT